MIVIFLVFMFFLLGLVPFDNIFSRLAIRVVKFCGNPIYNIRHSKIFSTNHLKF